MHVKTTQEKELNREEIRILLEIGRQKTSLRDRIGLARLQVEKGNSWGAVTSSKRVTLT